MPKEKIKKKMSKQQIANETEALMELLSPTRSIDLRIQKTFEELPEKFIILLLEKLKEYALVNARLIKHFCDNNVPGIYVSTNKPLEVLLDSLERQNIKCKNVFFVDAITRMSGEDTVTGPNYAYVDSPKNLIDLSVAIETAATKIKSKEKFVIVDSLSTLLVYNKPGIVEKFVHSIAGKARAWKAKGIFLMVENKQDKVIKTIAQFCDQTIEI